MLRRGLCYGVLFSLPLWLLIATLIWILLHGNYPHT